MYSIAIEGVYHRGGIIFDEYEKWKQQDEALIYGDAVDWRDDTLAGSCIIKVRTTSGTTYFSKGLLNEIGEYIKSKEEINVVYVNETLTSMQ